MAHKDCTVCHKHFDENNNEIADISILARHVLVQHGAKSPTCTEVGWHAYETCERCSYSTYVEVSANGHTPKDAVCENVVAATCSKVGTYDEVVYCSVCEAELSRTLKTTEKLKHVPNDAVTENAVAETCTDSGSYERVVYCSECGVELIRIFETVTACGHKYGTWQQEVAATCTTNGTKAHKDCTVCHKHFDENNNEIVNIAILACHVLVQHGAESPTCTEVGWHAYETCARCDYTTYTEISAHGHTAKNAVVENRVAATCTKAGTYDEVVYCSVCESELSRTPHTTELAKHIPSAAVTENIVAATCTDDGSYDSVVYCSECAAVISRDSETIPALGHEYGQWQQEIAFSCTTNGTKAHKDCIVCHKHFDENNKEITDIVIWARHILVEHDAQSPTCTEVGWNAYEKCAVCNYSTYKELPKVDHTPKEAVKENEVAATCKEEGFYYSVVYCSECNYVISQTRITVEKLKHTPSAPKTENKVDPSCEQDGSYDSVVYCAVCECEMERHTHLIAALEHQFGSWIEETSSSCIQNGTKGHKTCINCHKHFDENGNELADLTVFANHILVQHEAKEPSCTEVGWLAYETCERCDYTTYVEISAKGHTPKDAVKENEVGATCTKVGSYDEVVYCLECGEELVRTPKTMEKAQHVSGDAVIENVVAATCTKEGTYDEVVYCSVCAAEVSRTPKVTEKAEHTPKPAVFENTVDATCTDSGSRESVVYCSECGIEISRDSEIIAALGHEYGQWQQEVAATCTENGTKAHKDCTVCHKHFDENNNEMENIVIAAQHNFENGVCTQCGENELVEATGLEYSHGTNGYTVVGLGTEARTSFIIPSTHNGESVMAIASQAFCNCQSLAVVVIPAVVVQVDAFAFSGCGNITIYCEAESQPSGWMSNWADSDCLVVWNCNGESTPSEESDAGSEESFWADVVANPTVGTGYKLAMWQATEKKVLYAIAKTDNGLLTTAVQSEGATAMLEEANDGYYLKLGATYVTLSGALSARGTLTANVILTDNAATVFVLGELGQLQATVTLDEQSDEFFLGTYSTYTTLCAYPVSAISDTSVVDVSQFPARLVESADVGGETEDISCSFTPMEGNGEPSGTLAATLDCTNKPNVEVTKQGTYTDISGNVQSGNVQKTFAENGVTVVNDVGASTSAVTTRYDSSCMRCYANSLLTVKCANMKSVVIQTTTAQCFQGTETVNMDGVQMYVDGNMLVLTFTNPTDSITLSLVSQIRITTVAVYV